MTTEKLLIDGAWVSSAGTETFPAVNPATREKLAAAYPVSPWAEVERALDAAQTAFWRTHGWSGERFAKFLEQCRISATVCILLSPERPR